MRDLIDMGTDFARILHSQAAQAAQTPAAPDQQAASTPSAPALAPSAPVANTLVSLAAAFDQVARAVRRCILLAQSLADPKRPARTSAQHRTAAHKQIIRAVEDTIQRPSYDTDCDRDTAEALRAELHERLDAPDLDDDIQTRPVADIIKEICNDLGLDRMPGTRPFARRTPADVARLCAQAAAPSAARQDSAGPQAPGYGAAQRHPGPERDEYEPAGPAVTPRAPPGPVRPGLPDDPAEAVAFVLRHGARADARWHPPPGG